MISSGQDRNPNLRDEQRRWNMNNRTIARRLREYARFLERQQDLVIDLVAQLLHEALEHHEVEDEPRVLVERALERDAHAIVVAVQPFASMPGERDEVRRREDQIVLRDGDAELTAMLHRALHAPPLRAAPASRRRAGRRRWRPP